MSIATTTAQQRIDLRNVLANSSFSVQPFAQNSAVPNEEQTFEVDAQLALLTMQLADMDLIHLDSDDVTFQRTSLATSVAGTVQRALSQLKVDIWEFEEAVTSKPVPSDFGTWDWTPAFEAARVTISSSGGGTLTFGTGGIYQALEIRQDRFTVFDGGGAQVTELKQIAGANRDFIKSENFDALTGNNQTIANPLVPSWFGLRDIRVNGNRYNATTNPTGNTSGTPVKYYGPAQMLLGIVHISQGADMGLYTEDAAGASGLGWQGQEEGRFGDVMVMDSGGFAGWHCRGPHNNTANSITCGRNDGWGFYSEESATWGGSFDNIDVLHTYANGRATNPAADTGAHVGGIARIGTLVTDGDNPNLKADNLQIDMWRAFNLGGQSEAVIDGNDVQIGNFNGAVWSGSTGKTGLIINGNNCRITGTLTTNNPDNDGMWAKGTGHTIDMTVRNFSGVGRTGFKLDGTDITLDGKIRNCATAFDYASGNDNTVTLGIATSAGQVPVAGQGIQNHDRIDIRSRGTTVGGCKTNIQSAQVAIDTTVYTTVTTAHGLLYTPPILAVRVDWLSSSPDSTVWDEAFYRVVSTDATNVVIGYKMVVAAPAGTLARFGITIDLT